MTIIPYDVQKRVNEEKEEEEEQNEFDALEKSLGISSADFQKQAT